MAKKPSTILDDLVKQLSTTHHLTEFQRKDVPAPTKQAPSATAAVGEWVSSDVKNPFELTLMASPTETTIAKLRFPLTQALTDQQIDESAGDVLKLANGVEGNLSVAQNRLVLSYSTNITNRDGKSVLDAVIRRGSNYSNGLRTILDKTFGFPIDAGAEKWYQFKLGQPVKLSAAEMQQLQGGGFWGGMGTVVAGALGFVFTGIGGPIGGAVAGGATYAAEYANDNPDVLVPLFLPSTSTCSSTCAPICGVCSP
jgi:hypothetical protein